MNKRSTALILALLMLIGHLCIPGMEASAAGEQNRYGHAVTYSPITQLRAGGRTVRFFRCGHDCMGTVRR